MLALYYEKILKHRNENVSAIEQMPILSPLFVGKFFMWFLQCLCSSSTGLHLPRHIIHLRYGIFYVRLHCLFRHRTSSFQLERYAWQFSIHSVQIRSCCFPYRERVNILFSEENIFDIKLGNIHLYEKRYMKHVCKCLLVIYFLVTNKSLNI